jgi:hypothetical protein
MTEGILALAGFVLLVIVVVTILAAWVYSRFFFSGYIKKYHRNKWDELVFTDKLLWPEFFSFDITSEMHDFRVKSNDSLGDPRVAQIRRASILLFRVGILGWCGLMLAFIVIAGVSVLLKP